MNQDFSTYDLGLATALTTIGYKLVRLDKADSQKVKFIFKTDENINDTIASYWNDELKLPAQSLFNNQKMLKNRIYSDV